MLSSNTDENYLLCALQRCCKLNSKFTTDNEITLIITHEE